MAGFAERWGRRALVVPAHLVAAFDESLSSAQPKKARLAKVPMCQPTHEPHQHDNDAMVIDGFVVRCGAKAFESR